MEKEKRSRLKAHVSKLVMIFGTFDLLHPGHLFVLEEAAKRGRVTVIVARSGNVQRIKGKIPAQPEEERAAVIRKKFPSMNVLLGNDIDFLRPLRELRPDMILLGYDQCLPPGVTEDDLKPARVERLSAFMPERFKTSLIKRVKRGIMI